jgi:transcriptional regulator with XRE-family HTH domain
MSQAKVGAAMGTSQSAIARIESAQENITLDTLQRLIVALDGRFYVSIVPQEYPARLEVPWWESAQFPSTWNVVGLVSNRTAQSDQLLIGLERPHGHYIASAGTYAGGIVGLLEESTTR